MFLAVRDFILIIEIFGLYLSSKVPLNTGVGVLTVIYLQGVINFY